MQFNKSEVLLLLEDAMKAGMMVAEPYLNDDELDTVKKTLDKNIALLRGCWNIILGPDISYTGIRAAGFSAQDSL